MVWADLEDVLFDESTNEAIRSALPDPAITFFELVTHLGDGVTLIVLATLLYWFGGESNQRKRVLVIAIGIGALAISAGLKGIFVRPRPEMAGGYGGYSFPSAHALGSAAFYGSVAAIAETGTRGKRYAIAGTIIALVALSRVVIGVHYLGDVLVGVALGVLFVALVLRDDDPEPGFVFGLAGVITIISLVLGSTEYTTMTIGAAVGAFFAWGYVRTRSPNPRGAAIFVLAYVCLPPVFLLRAVTGVFEQFWLLEIVGYALATAAVLLVPVVAERMNDWPQVEWLQQHLPFTGRTVDTEELRRPHGD